MSARRNITLAIAAAFLLYPGLSAPVYGTPATEAPWINRDGDHYEAEIPRVEDLQPPVSPREQREVVEGAVRTVDNTAKDVTGTAGAAYRTVEPPPPQGILAAAGGLLANTADAIAGTFRAVFNTIFR